jgi:predicted dehydrogenase
MTEILRVLIIGCGNIAGGFDKTLSPTQLPCTHAGAYSRDQRFQIIACVDPNETVRKNFAKQWNIKHHFASLDDIADKNFYFDVISICSPTNFHYNDILRSITLKPKLIFCEKPITKSVAKTQLLIENCEQNDILLAVNYTRRWDPSILNLKQHIQNNSYGILRSVSGYYNKGILNNGSHLIDLLEYLVDEINPVHVLSGHIDYQQDDKTYPVLFLSKNKQIPIQFITAHADDYSLVEMEFIFSEVIIRMEQGGLRWSKRLVSDSQRFSGYKVLDKASYEDGHYQQAMLTAIENIYTAITKKETLLSDGYSALRTQTICAEICSTCNNYTNTEIDDD